MKPIFTRALSLVAATVCALAVIPQAANAGAFTPGNLAVLQADSATANNTTCTIVELNPATAGQTPANSVAISGAGANALRISGSAGTTGYLALTDDHSQLSFTGANSLTAGNANTLNPRGVGTLNRAGTFTLATTYTGTSGNQTRGATSVNNSAWFVAIRAASIPMAPPRPTRRQHQLRQELRRHRLRLAVQADHLRSGRHHHRRDRWCHGNSPRRA